MKFAPVLIKETFVTIGSSRDNHTLTGKDCVRAYIRTSKMVKTSKVTQEHRDLAFSLKEDLTRFANNVGYGNVVFLAPEAREKGYVTPNPPSDHDSIS